MTWSPRNRCGDEDDDDNDRDNDVDCDKMDSDTENDKNNNSGSDLDSHPANRPVTGLSVATTNSLYGRDGIEGLSHSHRLDLGSGDNAESDFDDCSVDIDVLDDDDDDDSLDGNLSGGFRFLFSSSARIYAVALYL